MNSRQLDRIVDRLLAVTMSVVFIGAPAGMIGSLTTGNIWWVACIAPGALGLIVCGLLNSAALWRDA